MKNGEASLKQRLNYLDILRVISVFLVIYGHFVSVGGNATSIPNIIAQSNENNLPILSLAGTGLSLLEHYLIGLFSTQSAILGVSIFFIITGYLMPKMMVRYSRSGFLLNRIFRIFPALVVANALIIFLVSWAQGIQLNWLNYFASSTLIYQFIKVAPVTGVLWTLVVEVGFYLVAALLGRFTYAKVFVLQVVLGTLLVLCYYVSGQASWTFVYMFAKYFLMILIGSSIFLAETSSKSMGFKFGHLLFSLFVSLLGFWLYRLAYDDISNYRTVGNHLLAVGLFIVFLYFHKKGLLRRTPGFVTFLSELVYPIYLLHTAFGLITMFLLRGFIDNTYLLLIIAVAVSLIVSWLLHIFVEQPMINWGKKFKP